MDDNILYRHDSEENLNNIYNLLNTVSKLDIHKMLFNGPYLPLEHSDVWFLVVLML